MASADRPKRSTPHDHVTIPQICSTRPLALDRPRQPALRFPAGVSDQADIDSFSTPPTVQSSAAFASANSLDRPDPIPDLARGPCIAITPAARRSVPLRAISTLGLSDDGRRTRGTVTRAAGIRNLFTRADIAPAAAKWSKHTRLKPKHRTSLLQSSLS